MPKRGDVSFTPCWQVVVQSILLAFRLLMVPSFFTNLRTLNISRVRSSFDGDGDYGHTKCR
jgi:hypothetical protein